jgi:hypothetical protein
MPAIGARVPAASLLPARPSPPVAPARPELPAAAVLASGSSLSALLASSPQPVAATARRSAHSARLVCIREGNPSAGTPSSTGALYIGMAKRADRVRFALSAAVDRSPVPLRSCVKVSDRR